MNWSTITVVVCTTGSSNMRAADHLDGDVRNFKSIILVKHFTGQIHEK